MEIEVMLLAESHAKQAVKIKNLEEKLELKISILPNLHFSSLIKESTQLDVSALDTWNHSSDRKLSKSISGSGKNKQLNES